MWLNMPESPASGCQWLGVQAEHALFPQLCRAAGMEIKYWEKNPLSKDEMMCTEAHRILISYFPTV